MKTVCRFRWLGLCDYAVVGGRMLQFTDDRNHHSEDEIWFLEHPRVFTLGTSSTLEPRINPDRIPLMRSKRGGQITFHAPGQLIAYCLLDIRRMGLGPRRLVELIEDSILRLLMEYGLHGEKRQGAPGVYVDGAKIAAIGLRIRKGCSFHGFSLNVNLDTTPFHWIDPCGYPGLSVTTLASQGVDYTMDRVCADLKRTLLGTFGMTESKHPVTPNPSLDSRIPCMSR